MSQDTEVSTRMRASARWAVGSFILVVLVTSEISGLGTLAALPIAAINAFLSALCHGDIQTYNLITKTPKRFRLARNAGDLFEFFGIWFDLLSQLVAVSTCARIISATMDYMSNGRSSDWLLGYQSHSLGEPWPDIMGLGIVIVVNIMFMLGLENSYTFFLIINIGIIGCLIFFAILGCMYADFGYWKHDNFLPKGFIDVFTTAALCSFGIMDVFPEHKRKNRYQKPKIQIFLIILLQIFTYTGLIVLFTLMSYFKELSGSAVPLIRVFEARDVDWARLIMASFTIVIIAIALMEFGPATFNLIVTLAGKDWNVLTRALKYENDTTGSPILAIFTAGSLSAILAFICPLSYLIRLLNIGSLLKHVCEAMTLIYYRYQPEDDVEDFPVCNEVEYCRLNQGTKRADKTQISGIKTRILAGSWFLPKSMRKNRATLIKDIVVDRKSYKQSGKSEESEYLLMGAYSPEPQQPPELQHSESNLDIESASDCSDGNDLPTITAHLSDSEENMTDIDAVVQEYKERLKVATTLTGTSVATVRLPSLTTGRFVLGAVLGVCAWSIALSVGILYDRIGIICGALSGALILTAMITAQPQVHLEHTFNQPVSFSISDTFFSMHTYLIPLVPVIVIVLNIILAAMVMPGIWICIILWFTAGLIVFVRCEECCWCWDCMEPQNPVHPINIDHSKILHRFNSENMFDTTSIAASPHSSLNFDQSRDVSQENLTRIAHVDTILIAR